MGIVMALLALGGILLAMFGIAVCGGAVGLVVWLIIKRPIVRLLVWFPTTMLLCGAAWFYLNRQELLDRDAMNRVSKDCGWKEYKTISDVDGIYLDVPAADVRAVLSFLPHYSAVEYYQRRGFLYHDQSNSSIPIEQRTFRYGVRVEKETIEYRIVRESRSFVDFDTSEVLAEHVMYSYVDNVDSKNFFDQMFYYFIKVHPASCGFLGSGDEKKLYEHVLQPKV